MADLELALSPPPGDSPLDRRILRLQAAVRDGTSGSPGLEELGRLWMAVARRERDESYAARAERAALLLEASGARMAAALNLRGQALVAQHRFAEAESLGRAAAALRGLADDHILLGDALLEQGKYAPAAAAYGAAMDLRPGFPAYVRAGELRFLSGDLDGAAKLLGMAVPAAGYRETEARAWALARLARILLLLGRSGQALAACDGALAAVPGHPAALAERGRILLHRGRPGTAAEALAAAARAEPSPENRRMLAEALRGGGRLREADSVEDALARAGPGRDRRGFALFLAATGRRPGEALRLALRERRVRGDIRTHEALAAAWLALGDAARARLHADTALSLGTREPRLLLVAGLACLAAGDRREGLRRLRAARSLAAGLLPSEQALLLGALRPDGTHPAGRPAARRYTAARRADDGGSPQPKETP